MKPNDDQLNPTSDQAAPAAGHPRARAQRVLNVPVPEEAWHQARMAALASRMTFKDYMARLLLTAMPMGNSSVNAP